MELNLRCPMQYRLSFSCTLKCLFLVWAFSDMEKSLGYTGTERYRTQGLEPQVL